MADIIQLRGGTAAEWTAADPVLAQKEVGVETDTYKLKIGDGVTVWSGLSYLTMGQDGADGTVYIFRGAWSGAITDYATNDLVHYQGNVYIGNNPTTNETPPGEGWALFVSQGLQGVQGEVGPEGPPATAMASDAVTVDIPGGSTGIFAAYAGTSIDAQTLFEIVDNISLDGGGA